MEFNIGKSRGITLIELMTTVTIVGITLSLAVPGFSRLLAKSAMTSSVNLFLSQLHLARSSAVTREKPITLCPASNPRSCSNNHKAWQLGYLVFQDDNKNHQPDKSEEILGYQERTLNEIIITTSSQFRNSITYLPEGRTWFSNTTIRFCHPKYPEMNRSIIVSNNGRVRVVTKSQKTPHISCK